MFILDCETRPDEKLKDLFTGNIKAPKSYTDPEKIKAYIEKKNQESIKGMSVDTDYADILCIGVKQLGGKVHIYKGEELEQVFKLINGETIITFNGKGFDLPLMIKYGVKNNLNLPYKRLKTGMRKYGQYGGHIDLLEELSGNLKFKSLDEYLQIYLDISKKPVDFATATDEEIIEHCKEDLVNTEKLYNKFEQIFI